MNNQDSKCENILNKYNLCLLDTNFISNISKTFFKSGEDNKIKTKNMLLKYINPNHNIVCVSPTTIKELNKSDEVYSHFKIFFNIFPFCILNSAEKIIHNEVQTDKMKEKDLILASISKFGNTELQNLLENPEIVQILKNTKENDKAIASDRIKNFNDAKLFETEELLEISIKNIVNHFKINRKDFDANKYPALRMSIYNEIFQLEKIKEYDIRDALSDSNDLMISTAVPYVDKFFTENKQAEFLKQMKQKKILNQDKKIYTIREIQ